MMGTAPLIPLLQEAQDEVRRRQYPHALKIIRDAKIIDLHNLYLSALEQYVTALQYESLPDGSANAPEDQEQILSLLIDRAVSDREQREEKQSEAMSTPDERTVLLEKVKNMYFQRADEFIEAKKFGRAQEEIHRIFFFDARNFAAKEYQQKIAQLADLNKK